VRRAPGACAAVGHGLDVRAGLQRLGVVADVADDVLVPADGEWDEGLVMVLAG
jgi:hypothetical protein